MILKELIQLKVNLAEVKEQVDVNELHSQQAIVRLSRHVDKGLMSSCSGERMDTIV